MASVSHIDVAADVSSDGRASARLKGLMAVAVVLTQALACKAAGPTSRPGNYTDASGNMVHKNEWSGQRGRAKIVPPPLVRWQPPVTTKATVTSAPIATTGETTADTGAWTEECSGWARALLSKKYSRMEITKVTSSGGQGKKPNAVFDLICIKGWKEVHRRKTHNQIRNTVLMACIPGKKKARVVSGTPFTCTRNDKNDKNEVMDKKEKKELEAKKLIKEQIGEINDAIQEVKHDKKMVLTRETRKKYKGGLKYDLLEAVLSGGDLEKMNKHAKRGFWKLHKFAKNLKDTDIFEPKLNDKGHAKGWELSDEAEKFVNQADYLERTELMRRGFKSALVQPEN